MATSPLFGWEEPDDTDLVKDGAAAIRTLGNAIDTSMGDLLGGTSGQVLSKASNTNMDFTWVTSDDANAIQNAIVDAKGDLIGATANDTPARLAVGANGTMLVANSAESTGLKWTTATDQYPWVSWTPSYSGITVGNGTVVAREQQIGKLKNWFFSFTLGSTSSIGSNAGFYLNLVQANVDNNMGFGSVLDVGVASYYARGIYGANNFVYIGIDNVTGTFGTFSLTSATVPFTWGTGDKIVLQGSCEVV